MQSDFGRPIAFDYSKCKIQLSSRSTIIDPALLAQLLRPTCHIIHALPTAFTLRGSRKAKRFIEIP